MVQGQEGKKGKIVAQVSSELDQFLHRDTPFQMGYENEVVGERMDLDQKLVNAVCQEMMKMFKGKGIDCNSNELALPSLMQVYSFMENIFTLVCHFMLL